MSIEIEDNKYPKHAVISIKGDGYTTHIEVVKTKPGNIVHARTSCDLEFGDKTLKGRFRSQSSAGSQNDFVYKPYLPGDF